MLQLVIPYKESNYKIIPNAEELETISARLAIVRLTSLSIFIATEILQPEQLPSLMICSPAMLVKTKMQAILEIPGSTPSGITVINKDCKFDILAINENIKDVDLENNMMMEITKNQEINMGQIIMQELSIIAGLVSLSQ